MKHRCSGMACNPECAPQACDTDPSLSLRQSGSAAPVHWSAASLLTNAHPCRMQLRQRSASWPPTRAGWPMHRLSWRSRVSAWQLQSLRGRPLPASADRQS